MMSKNLSLSGLHIRWGFFSAVEKTRVGRPALVDENMRPPKIHIQRGFTNPRTISVPTRERSTKKMKNKEIGCSSHEKNILFDS